MKDETLGRAASVDRSIDRERATARGTDVVESTREGRIASRGDDDTFILIIRLKSHPS